VEIDIEGVFDAVSDEVNHECAEYDSPTPTTIRSRRILGFLSTACLQTVTLLAYPVYMPDNLAYLDLTSSRCNDSECYSARMLRRLLGILWYD